MLLSDEALGLVEVTSETKTAFQQGIRVVNIMSIVPITLFLQKGCAVEYQVQYDGV